MLCYSEPSTRHTQSLLRPLPRLLSVQSAGPLRKTRKHPGCAAWTESCGLGSRKIRPRLNGFPPSSSDQRTLHRVVPPFGAFKLKKSAFADSQTSHRRVTNELLLKKKYLSAQKGQSVTERKSRFQIYKLHLS